MNNVVELSLDISGRNGSTAGSVKARHNGVTLHEEGFPFNSPGSQRRFCEVVAAKAGSPDSADEIETLLDDRIRQLSQSSVYEYMEQGHPGPGAVEVLADEPAEPRDDRSDPIPLNEVVAPPLPPGIFTGWLGDQIEAVSSCTETPPELAAMFGLATVATVCQKRFSIRIEQNYFEPLNVWTLSGLESGNRKTAVFRDMTSPLVDWEKVRAAEFQKELKLIESKRRFADERIKHLQNQAKKKDDPIERSLMEDEIMKLEDELPMIPSLPRLFSQDVTTEHLGTMLANNGERLSLLSDEGGIFEIIAGRYNSGIPNLDLLLQAHAGSPVRVDRGSRLPVMLDHPALTIGLSPQPDVLKSFKAQPGFRGRGLLARFLYTLPASRVGYRSLIHRDVPGSVIRAYTASILQLADAPPNLIDEREVPRTLMLSEETHGVWKPFQREVEDEMKKDGRLENLKDWGGKLPGAVARIAGLFHCCDFTSDILNQLHVDAVTMERAIRLGRFLIEHAIAAFDLMGADGSKEAARRLWGIIEKERKRTFTAREAWIPIRGTYKRIGEVTSGFDVLVEHNYIAPLDDMTPRQAGRPSRSFRVNPQLAQGWK